MTDSDKKTILVLDDSPSILTYLTESLGEYGYRVLPFSSPLDALKALEKKQPDLILSDVNMAHMDGFEFCQAVKEKSSIASIPVLFLSGEKRPKNIVKGFECGAVDYVTKPIVFEILCARIETHIKLYRLQKQTSHKNSKLKKVVKSKSAQVERSQMGTITALAKLAEYRDEDTGTHLERVQAYCQVLAEELSTLDEFKEKLTPEHIALIKDSSTLHDIGKVAIPDSILLKPGKLTPEEFRIMQSHSQHGADTLLQVLDTDPNNNFMKIGYKIALYHHEKWDGSGYPLGLKGDEIPLCARIMAVADVYDALRAERCYKKSFSHAKAYAIIEEGKGKHFDPRLVECFIKHESTFDEIWTKYTHSTIAEEATC